MVNETVVEFGKIDILVNNAGAGVYTNIEDPKFIPLFDNVFKLDLRAPAVLNHYAVPHLKKSNGTIIHISSIASMNPVFSNPMKPYKFYICSVQTSSEMPYNMAKSAMDMMTRCLALALGPNVRVNAVK